MRVRSKLSFAVHKYFQENGFNYVNTPIVTGSDAEGAGEMFRVSQLLTQTKLQLMKKVKLIINKIFLEKKQT